jgi:hypothetical protein
MPVFVPPAHHKGVGSDDLADRPGVDQLAHGLVSGTEEGVRCSADQQPLSVREVQHASGFGAAHGERLLVVNRLACLQCRQRNHTVGLGRGQVEHDLDRRVGQQLLDGQHAGHAELDCLCLGGLAAQVGASHDLDGVEKPGILQID